MASAPSPTPSMRVCMTVDGYMVYGAELQPRESISCLETV